MRAFTRPRLAAGLLVRINRLEARHKGKIVAIEPESGDYFLAETGIEAYRKALGRYPDKAFVFKRIGSRWTHRQVGGLRPAGRAAR